MPEITDFNTAKQALYEYIPKGTNVTKYNLDNITKLMKFLGNPQDKIKIIHVAGTSGKTSTSYYLAALLFNAGYSVGLTVSPHIDEINERAQINLQLLPEKEYCEYLSQFLKIIKKFKVQPSYFEVLIAFAYWLFEKKGMQYAIVEVGLGGLMDGTNVINRADKVCVITDIGLDHTKILGNTIKKIAFQKAGIIKHENAVFMYQQDEKVMAVIKKQAKEQSASLYKVQPNDTYDDLLTTLPLFQQRNIKLAIATVNYVINRDYASQLTTVEIKTATETYIPARMEMTDYKGKPIIMDGSHNEQKISALTEAIQRQFGGTSITLLVSFGENKITSVQECMKLLRKISSTIILTAFDIGQDEVRAAIKPDELEIYAKQAGFNTIIVEPDPILALEELIWRTNGIGLITGSFYLLNMVREVVLEKK